MSLPCHDLQKAVKDCRIIRASNAKSRKCVFRKPSEVYLSTKQNKTYFKSNPNIWFVSVNVSSKKLEKIGCHREIRIRSKVPSPGSNYISLAHYIGYHMRGVDLFDPDAEMDGLEFTLKHLNKERSKIIWKTLLRENNYKKVSGAIQRCKKKDFPFDYITIEEQTSKLGKLLTENVWLYMKNKKRKPSDLLLSELDKKSYEIDGSTPKFLSEKLGFIHNIKQEAEALGYIVLDKKDKVYNEFLKFKKQKEKEAKERDAADEEPQTPIDTEPTIDNTNVTEITHPEFTGTGGNGSTHTSSAYGKHDCSDGTPREKRFFDGLKDEYLKKGFQLIQKEKRRMVFKNSSDEIEILWSNSETKNKVGYDFEINRNGQIERVIELKTTRADVGATFTLSGAQWDKARDMHLNKEGEKYEVFCVYKADHEKPKTVRIKDPFRDHLEKHLRIIEVCISPNTN